MPGICQNFVNLNKKKVCTHNNPKPGIFFLKFRGMVVKPFSQRRWAKADNDAHRAGNAREREKQAKERSRSWIFARKFRPREESTPRVAHFRRRVTIS
jgi:hypothetical protein